MPNFREAYAYRNKFINKQEFSLLCDALKSRNPEFSYWNDERLDLDEKTNEWTVEFRVLQRGLLWTCWADAATWRDSFLQWFSGSYATYIMPVS